MDNVRMISTADVLCSFRSFQHNFQLLVGQRCVLCREFLVSLESPDRPPLLVALISLKSLIGAEYAKAFTCSHRQKSRGLRRLIDWASASHLLFTESLVQMLTMQIKWGGTPSCMNNMYCRCWGSIRSKNTGKYSPKSDGTQYTCYSVCKTVGPSG
jgi:hypothetical protein